jgi:hypothetical protein
MNSDYQVFCALCVQELGVEGEREDIGGCECCCGCGEVVWGVGWLVWEEVGK